MKRLLQIQRTLARSQVCQFSSVAQGSKFSTTFKQYLTLPEGQVGSWFHDVPLDFDPHTRTVNMVNEIPRWSQAKFEISKQELFNPIMQDCKGGNPRFVKNLFPFHGYIHNYGALPQTWEDPTKFEGKFAGDNDPLDICEIGSQVLETGSIKRVKLLGSLALIDDNELDWKVIAIDCQDPLASKVNNLSDVESYFPHLLYSTREWFRNYKIPDGKPANQFAFNEQYKDVDDTLNIVLQCHDSWKQLISGQAKGDNLPNTFSVYEKNHFPGPNNDESFYIPIEHNDKREPDSKMTQETNKWYYL